MRIVLCVLACLALTSCTGDSDNANQTNGPPIEVHCAAASPTGATTVRVQCPPP
jgi:hypothetical protein